MNSIGNIISVIRNKTLNSLGVERTLDQLLRDGDVGRAKSIMQDRDEEVREAIMEYDPETHKVMNRRDKPRKGKEPYRVEKLPRTWQRFVNEIALFFLLANPIKWSKGNKDEASDEAYQAFEDILTETRFHTTMREAKRLAGAETESAKLYHIYRDDRTGFPAIKVVVLAKSKGYTLRPLFDQYGNLLAFGYGYFLKEGVNTVEHFDVQTPDVIYNCKKTSIGWSVDAIPNPTGKINVIYYQQEKEWDGAQRRIDRDEMIDSKTADTNNYFADPKLKVTADIVASLPDSSKIVGEVIQMQGEKSIVEYLTPPTAPEMKNAEKEVLRQSILQDTFTPDFSYENMRGMGTLSGEALRRALILGFIKRDNRLETYDIAVDREKNLILAIMANVTHVRLRSQIKNLKIAHKFAEPFAEDENARWSAIGKAYNDGIISLETAVELAKSAKNIQEEIDRIKAAKEADKQEPTYI